VSAALSLVRTRWLVLTSYRVRTLVSLGGLLASVIPLYFVAGAVQPIMGDAIATQGGQAFGFLLVGLATLSLVNASVNALQSEVGSGIKTGTLEAMLATPVSLGSLLSGLAGFNLLWTGIRCALMLVVGWTLGANLIPGQSAYAAVILALIVAAHLPFGILGAALVLAFRTAGPLPKAVNFVSALLGGVYYPTEVVPSWLELVSACLPLTYGLRALRRVYLEGESLLAVSGDLAVMVMVGFVLLALTSSTLIWALRYARREGTLAQY
jgi:ABC-2 type transport system permease protein